MANLPAIVRATRASASALERMQHISRKLAPMRTIGNRVELNRALDRARRDYERAQTILTNNPI